MQQQQQAHMNTSMLQSCVQRCKQLAAVSVYPQLYNFINRRHVSPKDLVLLTDGFDVAIDAKALDKVPAHFAAITSSRSLLSQQDGFWRGSNSSTNSTPHDLALVFAAERGLW